MKRTRFALSHLRSLLPVALALCTALLAPASVSAAAAESLQEAVGAEEGFVCHVRDAAHIFAYDHGRRAPTSWADVFEVQPQLRTRFEHPFMPLYAFLGKPVPLPPSYGRDKEIMVMTRRPFPKVLRRGPPWRLYFLAPPGRYVVLHDRSGEHASFDVKWMDESEIQQIFHDREALLPTPDTEPVRPWEAEVRWWWVVYYTCMTTIALLLLVWLMRRVYRYSITGPRHASPPLAGDKA